MINAAITIIYSPKTMFHAVHPCSFAALSFDLLLFSLSLSLILFQPLREAWISRQYFPHVRLWNGFMQKILKHVFVGSYSTPN